MLQAPDPRRGSRPAHRRGRRPPLALPAGADPVQEDGEGPHLLAGDRRLHEHQRDTDPPRSFELREVRQARRRLLDRLAPLRDPEDPSHAGAAQHCARGRRPARPGDRELADLRRARHQHRRGLRFEPERDRRRRRRHDRRGRAQAQGRRARQEHRRRCARSAGRRCAEGCRRSRRRRGADHLQLLRGSARRAERRDRAHLEPRGRVVARAVLSTWRSVEHCAHPALARLPPRRNRVECLHPRARA